MWPAVTAQSPPLHYRRPSQIVSPSRRYRAVLALVSASSVLLCGSYLLTDRTSTLTPLFSSSNYRPIDVDPKVSLDLLHAEERLWSYIGDEGHGADAWRWVGKQRAEGYRRPSWGGMRQQGAKAHVRENMKEGKMYLTTFPEAGNEVIETCNLAIRSGRIPVLSPLVPDDLHLGVKTESFLPLTEVFDFTDFIAQHHVPVIDIFELKVGNEDWISIDDRHRSVVYDGEFPQAMVLRPGQPAVYLQVGDTIAAERPELDKGTCWNAYMTVQEDVGGHISTLWPEVMEQTPLPISVFSSHPHADIRIKDISLPRVADVLTAYQKPTDTLPAEVNARLADLGEGPSNMSPDDPLGCINRMYYLHLHPESEDVQDDWRNGVGAWDEAGKYLKFQPGLVRLAGDLVRTLLGVKAGEEVPPYMAIHIRRTDFADNYRHATQRHWAYQAWKLLHEAKAHRGADVRRVVFTTDEEDEEWLDELRKLGWIYVDHKKAQTGQRLGWWFPTILDSIILSSAKVFLGVPSSTMSILPYRRVLDWNAGVARFIPDPTSFEVPADWHWAEDW